MLSLVYATNSWIVRVRDEQASDVESWSEILYLHREWSLVGTRRFHDDQAPRKEQDATLSRSYVRYDQLALT